ncbi:hypothetical protein K3495_g11916 [Podosphaera aphanis]|nr:hypothetical protein K3495_g11916 [Podosphaera aphanis]
MLVVEIVGFVSGLATGKKIALSIKGDHANVITENQYNRDDYLCPDEHAAVVVETALMSTYINKPSWKIDSGATRHFSGKLGDFSGLKRWSSPKYVSTADGNTCPSDDVWYVPAFKDIRLISVGALNRDNISVVFEDCVATARTKGIVLFEAPLCDNLYQLVDKPRKSESHIQHSLSAHQSGSTAQSPLSIDEMSRVPSNDAELWHFRLAHASYKTISRLPNMPQKPKAISKGENACEACLAGKMKETFSKKTDNRTSRPARRLHADISGKLPTSLSSGERAVFFTADNGTGEFGQAWKDWCRSLGIEVQPSPSYKHSLNGVAERAIGFLIQLAKSMIFHAQLDWKSYWCYAIEHAMHIRNRLPTTALPFGPEDTRPGSNITPISAFTDKAISLQKLRVFGCAAFPLAFKETKIAPSKFAPNIETNWIFIGIQSNSIWILLNRKTGTEKRTVDCQFKEHVFPGIIRQGESHSPSNPQIQASLPRDKLTSHQTHARPNHSTQESMGQDLESQQRLRSNSFNNTCRVTDSDPDLESHRLR